MHDLLTVNVFGFQHDVEFMIVKRVSQCVQDSADFFFLDFAGFGRVEHRERSPEHFTKIKISLNLKKIIIFLRLEFEKVKLKKL